MSGTLSGPNYLPFDIETIANATASAYYAQKKYEAPVNYKDKEKIEKYVLERRHEDQKKAALSWWTGKVVCINVRSLHKKVGKTFVGENEAKLLDAFFTWVTKEGNFMLIGKSSKHFDSPFIVGRCIALNIGVPDFLRPYRPVEDIDEVFGFGSRADQASKLDDYAAGMGIKTKNGHGTDVQYWYNAATTGEDPDGFKKIASYCEGDVDIVEEFLRRWTKKWTPTSEAKEEKKAKAPPTPEIVSGVEIPFQPEKTEPVVTAPPPQQVSPIRELEFE